LSGDELMRVLRAAYGGHKGVFQVSGLELKLAKCVSAERLKTATLEGGKAISPTKRYRVVMPDFLAHGGDGLGPVMASLEPAHVDFGMNRPQNLRDLLVSFWQTRKAPLEPPKPGRVALSSDPAPCPP